MIDALITALNQELALSAKEIADLFWLAMQVTNELDSPRPTLKEIDSESVSRGDSARLDNGKNRDNSDSKGKSHKKKDENEPKAGLYPRRSSDFSDSSGLGFKVPDAPALREPLTLARALKPLMRRLPTGTHLVLDEEATIERIAAEGIWLPVLRPTLESWLDLELVVEEGISMQIWRQTIADLERLFKNYGIFRDVRVWSLLTDKHEQVRIRRGIGSQAKGQSLRSPAELVDPTGRRLILVVSDCVSLLWRNGKLAAVLELWTKQGSMAIVQMLPKWLWKRTALGRASEVLLQGLLPGDFNQQLIVREVSLWEDLEEVRGAKVPVFSLEVERVAIWAQMLSGRSVWATGYLFKLEDIAVSQTESLFNLNSGDLTAEDRVQGFRVTASPMARKLAGLLAAAPMISLPIVRLIQETLLRESQQVHVAEVFLGGLLEPLPVGDLEVNPNDVLYKFMDGVRDLLIDSVPSGYVLNVVDEVSKYVAKRVGLSLKDFAAALRNSQAITSLENATNFDYFATVTAQVLRSLGGEYTKVADELEAIPNIEDPKIEKIFDEEISKGDCLLRIAEDQVGLVRATFGNPSPPHRTFGKVVECNNFQDAEAFIKNGGESGKQLNILTSGTYRINTDLFEIKIDSVIKVPLGEIGLVVANGGAHLPIGRILGKVVECENFQDAEAFIHNGGESGKQLAILPTGSYQINTDLFTVITSANATQYSINPEELKFYTVGKDQIGIVTTLEGKTLPEGEIAGNIIEDHDNFQNPQKFIEAGGYRGLQEEVLQEGSWILNPWFVRVEQVPLVEILPEQVGVIISYVGKDNESKNDDRLSEEGYKGVQRKPLLPGKYAINRRIKSVHVVPTYQIILTWSNSEEKAEDNYDKILEPLQLRSKDGFVFQLQLTQAICIVAKDAPQMILNVGTQAIDPLSLKYSNVLDNTDKKSVKSPAIRNLVGKVLAPLGNSYFQSAAQALEALDFFNQRSFIQRNAADFIKQALNDYGVQSIQTLITDIDLPDELKNLLRERQILQQQAETYKQQAEKLAGQFRMQEFRDKVKALSPQIYAQLESERKWAEAYANTQIKFPEVFVDDSNSSEESIVEASAMQMEFLEILRDSLKSKRQNNQIDMSREHEVLPPSIDD